MNMATNPISFPSSNVTLPKTLLLLFWTTKRGLPSKASFIFCNPSRSRAFVHLSARAVHRLKYAPS